MTALVYQRICFAILYNTFQRNSAGFWVLSQNPKFSTIWGYNKNKSLKGKKEKRTCSSVQGTRMEGREGDRNKGEKRDLERKCKKREEQGMITSLRGVITGERKKKGKGGHYLPCPLKLEIVEIGLRPVTVPLLRMPLALCASQLNSLNLHFLPSFLLSFFFFCKMCF